MTDLGLDQDSDWTVLDEVGGVWVVWRLDVDHPRPRWITSTLGLLDTAGAGWEPGTLLGTESRGFSFDVCTFEATGHALPDAAVRCGTFLGEAGQIWRARLILGLRVAVGSLIRSIGTLSSNGVKLSIISVCLRQIIVGLVGVVTSAGIIIRRVRWLNISIESISRFLGIKLVLGGILWIDRRWSR